MSWQRVRGHESVVATLERAVRQGRLAHAYLFTGLPGVGKRLFAEELAKTLLCEGRDAERFEACDRCDACVQCVAGTHPDLITACRPADKLELPIDVVRELIQALGLKPARSRGKVAILDDADDLNDESANCFLKTLEEPPPASLLLLIARSSDRQLPTILSRCQVLRFAPLPAAVLDGILKAKDLADAALRERLVRLSGGSVAQALALADPALWEFRRTLTASLAGKADRVALAQQWMGFVEEAGKEAADQRRRASLTLSLLIDFLKNALQQSVGAAPRSVDAAELAALEQLAQAKGTEKLLAMLERCLEAERQIDRRVQLILVLEALTDAL